ELYGVKYCHYTVGGFIKMLPNAELKVTYIYYIFTFSYTYHIAKPAEGFRWIASAAHTAYGRHTGVVPAGYVFFVYKLQQLALAHYSIGKVAAGKFILPRWKNT